MYFCSTRLATASVNQNIDWLSIHTHVSINAWRSHVSNT